MTKFEKARAWRLSLNLTQAQLGAKLGYSKESICWFEAGLTPPVRMRRRSEENRQIKDWVWRRFELACSGLDMELTEGKWNWGK